MSTTTKIGFQFQFLVSVYPTNRTLKTASTGMTDKVYSRAALWARAIKNVKKPPGEKGLTFRKSTYIYV